MTQELELLPALPETTRWVGLRNPALELAREIANTDFVPKGLRGNPPAILACILYGDEIGLGPMQSLTHIAVIEGRPSQSAEIQRANILRAGHKIWVVEATNTKVTMAGQRAGDEQTSTVTWTMDDAKRARLDGKNNWRQYPRAMLTARASAELARMLFPDVIGGLAAAEELDGDGTLQVTDTGSPSGAGEVEPAGSTTRRRRRASTPPASGAAASSPEILSHQPSSDTSVEARADQPNGQNRPPLPGELQPETGEAAIEAAEAVIAHEHDLAAQARAQAVEPETMTDPQRRKLNALFRDKGITERPERLSYAATVAGHPLTSSNELTVEEAAQVIDALEQWHPEDPLSNPFPEEPQ